MRIEKLLTEKINQLPDGNVKEAMMYSLTAGGKRIRPTLLYLTAGGYGLSDELCDPFAIALEMIHTYSLIHDDLPAMDNDDLRRGKPTCHRKFGEANAILAGDGLLTYAFQIAAQAPVTSEKALRCIQILAEAAGPAGMVYGQDLDISEDPDMSWEQLKKVHRYKTGCLLSAPVVIGAVLAGRNESEIKVWNEIGVTLGLAFQIQDDILDIELSAEEFGKSNSDVRNEKVTSVTLLGRESAVVLMNELYEQAEKKINAFSDFNASALSDLIDALKRRRK